MMDSTVDILRRLHVPVLVATLVAALLVLGAGAAGAQGTAQPAGYLGGSSSQGSEDVNPSVVVPLAATPQSRAMALTGTDLVVALVGCGAALVAVGLFVAGGARLASRRR